MIQIFCQSTHMGIDFSGATKDDKKAALNILNNKFIAEDIKMRHSWAVKSGHVSPYKNFFISDKNILPIGFLPFVEHYFKEQEIEYAINDLRRYPAVNKKFVKALLQNELDFGEYVPRDYQLQSIAKVVKNKGGIIKLPMGCLSGDSEIEVMVDDALFDILEKLDRE